MKWLKVIQRIGIALVLVLLGLAFALWMKPPEILRVGANYSAKIVCSNVFLAGRDPDEVLRTDVQAPGFARCVPFADPSTPNGTSCVPGSWVSSGVGWPGGGRGPARPEG